MFRSAGTSGFRPVLFQPHSAGSSCVVSPRTETADKKKSVPDGSVISLKLQPFALTAKNRYARRWCCLSTTRQSTPCPSSVQCLSSRHRAVGWWLTAGTGAVAPMRPQTEWTDLLEIVPESSAARLCDFSWHVMVLVMHTSLGSLNPCRWSLLLHVVPTSLMSFTWVPQAVFCTLFLRISTIFRTVCAAGGKDVMLHN